MNITSIATSLLMFINITETTGTVKNKKIYIEYSIFNLTILNIVTTTILRIVKLNIEYSIYI